MDRLGKALGYILLVAIIPAAVFFAPVAKEAFPVTLHKHEVFQYRKIGDRLGYYTIYTIFFDKDANLAVRALMRADDNFVEVAMSEDDMKKFENYILRKEFQVERTSLYNQWRRKRQGFNADALFEGYALNIKGKTTKIKKDTFLVDLVKKIESQI